MNKLLCGVILILMMLGHNYVINQPQSLQKQLQNIHGINVTQFNLLYSIPSILALLTIIPIGYIYHKYPNFTLLFGVAVLFIGQLLVSLFGSEGKQYFYSLLITGRTFEGTGAEILYMIQGNLASSWMSHLAGLIFILP